jgi:hypothetical protein
MSEAARDLIKAWGILSPKIPAIDPLIGDIDEYLEAGEWGIACEGMMVLIKRYQLDTVMSTMMEPIIQSLIIEEEKKEKV